MSFQEYCELEYKKLTEMEDVDKNLINYPVFYQVFKEAVMNATKQQPEEYPIEIRFSKIINSIIITAIRDYPDKPHGEFRGLNELFHHIICLEEHDDKTFLCLRTNVATMARNHRYQKGNLLCFDKGLDVYENRTQVGRMRFGGSTFKKSTFNHAVMPLGCPELEVGLAIHGMLPSKKENTDSLDYIVESVGRYAGAPDDIVIKRSAYNTPEGEYKGYREKEEYLYTNCENSQSLNNLSETSCISRKYMDNSDGKLFDDSFETLEELLEYYSNKYNGEKTIHRK